MSRKLSIVEFISKARKKHNNNYCYSLSVYKNNQTKIKIICANCQEVFEQTPSNHLKGCGCPKCSTNRTIKCLTKDSLKNWKHICYEKYNGRFDYSKVIWKNAHEKVTITCQKCGNIFEQTPANHRMTPGCKICRNHKLSDMFRLREDEFISRSVSIYGDIFDYSQLSYTNVNSSVTLFCKRCELTFTQPTSSHFSGTGCPKCDRKISKGEKNVKCILEKLNIDYLEQYTFEDLLGVSGKRKLPFDFFLPKYNCVIEYDGIQHFKPISYFGGEDQLKYTINHDNMKNKYCHDKGIIIIRIKYSDSLEILTQMLGKMVE